MNTATDCGVDVSRESFAQRAQAYSFFSNVFMIEVNDAFLEGLKGCAVDESEQMSLFISSLDACEVEKTVADLKADFASTFLNMSAHPAFTSESVYLSDDHIMMQEQRDEVLESYRRCGFSVSDSFREPEDHIAVELAFMSSLCERAARIVGAPDGSFDRFELEECVAAQRDFIVDHLAKWTPLFCAEVKSSARTPFYRGVAEMLESFIEQERLDVCSR